MNKKLLVSLFLFNFIFSIGVIAEEKAKSIEFLVSDSAMNENLYVYTPTNHAVREAFNSGTLLTLHVSPSPKSEALFFDSSAQFWFARSNFESRNSSGAFFFSIISDLIPHEYDVWGGMTVFQIQETNYSGEESYIERSWRREKLIMKRNSYRGLDGHCVRVSYSGTLTDVPEDIAIPIINSLMDNGFDIEIHGEGTIKGMKWVRIVGVWIEITRLLKK